MNKRIIFIVVLCLNTFIHQELSCMNRLFVLAVTAFVHSQTGSFMMPSERNRKVQQEVNVHETSQLSWRRWIADRGEEALVPIYLRRIERRVFVLREWKRFQDSGYSSILRDLKAVIEKDHLKLMKSMYCSEQACVAAYAYVERYPTRVDDVFDINKQGLSLRAEILDDDKFKKIVDEIMSCK